MQNLLTFLILLWTSFTVATAQTAVVNNDILPEMKFETFVDGSTMAIIESTDGSGEKTIQVVRNGVILETVRLSPAVTEEALPDIAQENEFKRIRQDLLITAYKALQATKAETALVSADATTTVTAEIPNQDESTQATKTSFLRRAKQKIFGPLVESFYRMRSDQKQVILNNSEYGLSLNAQLSPALVVNRFGFGILFGLGLDIGYNRDLKKIMISFYEIHGRSSGGFSIDAAAGAGLGAYFRANIGNNRSATLTESKGVLGRLFGIVSNRERRVGQYANIGLYVLSSVHESTPDYASIQGQLGFSINPVPGALEIKSTVNAFNFGFTSPHVFFQKIGVGVLRLRDWIEVFWIRAAASTDILRSRLQPAGDPAVLRCSSVL